MTELGRARTMPGARGDGQLAARVDQLVQCFERIARQGMAGLPIVHPGLAIEAIGFRLAAAPADAVRGDDEAVGVLVTPWFMNLVWLPLLRRDDEAGVGLVTSRTLADRRFEALGGYEPDVGAFSACSLFSPMFDFVDMSAARATALAVLQALEPGHGADKAGPAEVAHAAALVPRPGRRHFLVGRRGAGQ